MLSSIGICEEITHCLHFVHDHCSICEIGYYIENGKCIKGNDHCYYHLNTCINVNKDLH